MWRDILEIIALLLLSPLIGIAVSIFSLLFFVAFPIWIAWEVFLEKVLKREPGLNKMLTPRARSCSIASSDWRPAIVHDRTNPDISGA